MEELIKVIDSVILVEEVELRGHVLLSKSPGVVAEFILSSRISVLIHMLAERHDDICGH